MKMVIIDASLASNWLLEDEKNARAEEILLAIEHNPQFAPSIFWHEMRNIFVLAEKRRRATQAECLHMLEDLQDLKIKKKNNNDGIFILQLAFQYGLSAYDAAYLALAVQEKAIMATNDKKLLQAAIAQGLEYRTTLEN